MTTIPESLNTALQLLSSGQLDRADAQCRRVLQIDPCQPDALHVRGMIAFQSGKSDIAVNCITKAIEYNPGISVYYYNLGFIFAASGNLGKAASAYKQAICLKPDYAEAINNLGLILYEQNNIEESMILFQQAIRNKPDFTNAYYNLGNALQTHGNPQAAIEAYDQVLKMQPDSAETRFNRSLSLLLTANFKAGWVEYEWRFSNLKDQEKTWSEKGIHRWDGSPFAGKRLLVLDEQGIGDTLQFVRYLPMVKKLGGTVLFETIQPLMGLLNNYYGVDELLDRASAARYDSKADLYIPLMSLPGIFNTSLKTIPADTPYLYADAAKVRSWRRRLKKDATNIGIVWAGKPTAQYDSVKTSGLEHVDLKWAGAPASKIADSRSNGLEYFAPLAQIPGVRLYGLQKGPGASQARELVQLNVINLGEEFKDFSDTAAAIANLDLVVSVDTSVAHLAGAMGKPVWVLIPFVPDWRWMLEREDSPWYPSMRLFRQPKRGDWDTVFLQLARELYARIHP
jgi:tetratricopeptide (TPR) repeat protein